MARLGDEAAFVKTNVPLGQENALTSRDAVDVVAYFTRQPGPDFARKSQDWPKGGSPAMLPTKPSRWLGGNGRGVVALSSALQCGKILGRQPDSCCLRVLLQVFHRTCAGDRKHRGRTGEEPRERDLSWRRGKPRRDALHSSES